MKKFLLTAVSVLLVLSMLSGCGKSQAEPPVDAESSASSTEPTAAPSVEASPAEPSAPPAVETTPAEPEENVAHEGDASSDSVDAVYEQQIERYYTAISNQWDEGAYFDYEMSPMVAYYYEGTALDNVGFTFVDLDGDDSQELIIGAIMNAELHPLVFEIWTIENGEPIMLAQSGSHNRYYLQYAEEDGLWSVAYEAENGAANRAIYYLQLSEGKFEVIQGVLFDAMANESAPWFMAYDLDWDASNDMPIDEDTANAVMEVERNRYIAVTYHPYSLYN